MRHVDVPSVLELALMQSKSRRKELLSDSGRDQTPSESELHLPARAHVSNVMRADSSAGDDAMKQPSANTPTEPPALGLQLKRTAELMYKNAAQYARQFPQLPWREKLVASQRGLIAMEDVTLNGLTFVTMVLILIGLVRAFIGIVGGSEDAYQHLVGVQVWYTVRPQSPRDICTGPE